MTRVITRPLKENEDGIPGYIAFPEREEKGPGLLLIHQHSGLTDFEWATQDEERKTMPKTEKIVPNHLVSTDIRRFPKAFRDSRSLAGRAVLVQHCDRIDIERGHIRLHHLKLGHAAYPLAPWSLARSSSRRAATPSSTCARRAPEGVDLVPRRSSS